MYNLYHKVAVASVCTALGFAFGANKEAKAATFSLTPTSSFIIVDSNGDGVGDYSLNSFENLPVGIVGSEEARAFYEFNIANLSLPYNTVISQAIFQARVDTVSWNDISFQVDLSGYTAPIRSLGANFVAGGYLGSAQPRQPGQVLSFDVASFINYNFRNNNDALAGFRIRTNRRGNITINENASLIVTTVDVAESVPEPTTMLTAAVALGWGGWLKRKKSS